MANLDKSLELADALIGTLSNEEFKSILRKVKSLGISGPTYDEYLANFETGYDNLFNFDPAAGEYYLMVASSVESDPGNTLGITAYTQNEISVVEAKSNFSTGFNNTDSVWSNAA